MIHLSASVLSVLANLGYRVEEGEGAFYPCYLGSGALPPVAYIRAEGESWQVAVAKRVVPRLAEDSLSQMAVDVQCPDDAAFLVAIVDRDRLYGVFELIASACMHQAPLVPGGERSGETWDPPPLPPFLQAVDRLLDEAQAGQTPPETVIKALREVRIGQDRFRAALLAQWGHACAVTGLGVPRLLRAIRNAWTHTTDCCSQPIWTPLSTQAISPLPRTARCSPRRSLALTIKRRWAYVMACGCAKSSQGSGFTSIGTTRTSS
jgi:hypothetical protein